MRQMPRHDRRGVSTTLMSIIILPKNLLSSTLNSTMTSSKTRVRRRQRGSYHLLTNLLASQSHFALSLLNPSFSTFHSKNLQLSKPTTRLSNELPFFAAPSSFTSPPSTSSTPQSSTVTLRLPLGT